MNSMRMPKKYMLATVRNSRGQSLIVAVIVMFVMLFIGGIFVGLVARNLSNSGRAADTDKASELARAGINYCDGFLMNSPEGADWRPAPTKPISQQDPDILWLRGGDWSRVDMPGGRALVRVTYQPDYSDDPTDTALVLKRKVLSQISRKIKIEAIGRVGVIDPNDPTTLVRANAPRRLRREFVAYKNLALPDNLLFVTNKNNNGAAQADFGVPPVSIQRLPQGYTGPQFPLVMQLGGMPVQTHGGTGSLFRNPGVSMQFNCALNLYGPVRLNVDPLRGDAITVAGDIHPKAHEPGFGPRFINAFNTAIGGDVLDSSDPSFTTFAGLIRDGSGSPDGQGYPRSISRVEPPDITVADPNTGLSRYRLATANSGPDINGIKGGLVGMGSGIFIDNADKDLQNLDDDAQRREWLDAAGGQGSWSGPIYAPAGVYIEPGYPVVQQRDADANLVVNQFVSTPGFRIERDDKSFRDPSGQRVSPKVLDFTFFIYKPINARPVLKVENEIFRSALKAAPFNLSEKQIDRFIPAFNGVIYSEGNAKIRGLLAGKANIPIRRELASETNTLTDAQIRELANSPALTLVSGGHIYIEGSLIRESGESMIGLLAKDCIVLNTTTFVKPKTPTLWSTDQQTNSAPYHATIDIGTPITLDFMLGNDPSAYVDTNGNAMGLNLLVRSENQQNNPSYVNLFVNDWYQRTTNSPIYPFDDPAVLAVDPTAIGVHPVVAPEIAVLPLLTKKSGATYLFTGDASYPFPQGMKNSLTFGVDPNYTQTQGGRPYLFGGAAIVPMDVRVEALMYAQEGCFFVIPGLPFNMNASDTPKAALNNAAAAGLPAGSQLRPAGVPDLAPFQGEPIDCRITIVGSIAANKTAPIADQAAWMQMWGYIPETYGSTGRNPNSTTAIKVPRQHLQADDVGLASGELRQKSEIDAGITRGIRYIYDPALATPYVGYDPRNRAYRTDDAYYDQANPGNAAGRVLPPIPRLPVCPKFAYYGEVR